MSQYERFTDRALTVMQLANQDRSALEVYANDEACVTRVIEADPDDLLVGQMHGERPKGFGFVSLTQSLDRHRVATGSGLIVTLMVTRPLVAEKDHCNRT